MYGSDKTTNFTPATDAKAIYLPLADGTLVALNVSDGKLRWKTEAGGNFSASPAADENTLYVATEYPAGEKDAVRGTLRALSKDTGITLWMRTLQAPLRGSLAAGSGAVFAGAANGGVHAFDKRTGDDDLGKHVTATDSTRSQCWTATACISAASVAGCAR